MADNQLQFRITADVLQAQNAVQQIKEKFDALTETAKKSTDIFRDVKNRLGEVAQSQADLAIAKVREQMMATSTQTQVLNQAISLVNQQFKQGKITAEEYKQSLKLLENELKNVGNSGKSSSVKDLISQFATAHLAMQPFIGALRGIINVANELKEQLFSVNEVVNKLHAVFTSDKMTAESMQYTSDIAKKYGLEINTLRESYAKFSGAIMLSNQSLDSSKKTFESVSSAISALHLSTEKSKMVFLALEQMMSKGTVQAQELKLQLGEHLPGAMGLAAKSMGVSIQKLMQMMEDGQVMSAEFLPKFAQELKKQYGLIAEFIADESPISAMNRLKNTWNAVIEEMGSSGLNELFKNSFNALAETIDNNKETIVALGVAVGYLAEILAVTVGVLGNFAGAIGQILGYIGKGFKQAFIDLPIQALGELKKSFGETFPELAKNWNELVKESFTGDSFLLISTSAEKAKDKVSALTTEFERLSAVNIDISMGSDGLSNYINQTSDLLNKLETEFTSVAKTMEKIEEQKKAVLASTISETEKENQLAILEEQRLENGKKIKEIQGQINDAKEKQKQAEDAIAQSEGNRLNINPEIVKEFRKNLTELKNESGQSALSSQKLNDSIKYLDDQIVKGNIGIEERNRLLDIYNQKYKSDTQKKLDGLVQEAMALGLQKDHYSVMTKFLEIKNALLQKGKTLNESESNDLLNTLTVIEKVKKTHEERNKLQQDYANFMKNEVNKPAFTKDANLNELYQLELNYNKQKGVLENSKDLSKNYYEDLDKIENWYADQYKATMKKITDSAEKHVADKHKVLQDLKNKEHELYSQLLRNENEYKEANFKINLEIVEAQAKNNDKEAKLAKERQSFKDDMLKAEKEFNSANLKNNEEHAKALKDIKVTLDNALKDRNKAILEAQNEIAKIQSDYLQSVADNKKALDDIEKSYTRDVADEKKKQLDIDTNYAKDKKSNQDDALKNQKQFERDLADAKKSDSQLDTSYARDVASEKKSLEKIESDYAQNYKEAKQNQLDIDDKYKKDKKSINNDLAQNDLDFASKIKDIQDEITQIKSDAIKNEQKISSDLKAEKQNQLDIEKQYESDVLALKNKSFTAQQTLTDKINAIKERSMSDSEKQGYFEQQVKLALQRAKQLQSSGDLDGAKTQINQAFGYAEKIKDDQKAIELLKKSASDLAVLEKQIYGQSKQKLDDERAKKLEESLAKQKQLETDLATTKQKAIDDQLASQKKLQDETAKFNQKQSELTQKLSDLQIKYDNDKQASIQKLSDLESKYNTDRENSLQKLVDLQTKYNDDKANSIQKIADLEAKHEEEKLASATKLEEIETKYREDKEASIQKLADLESKYEEDKAKNAKALADLNLKYQEDIQKAEDKINEARAKYAEAQRQSIEKLAEADKRYYEAKQQAQERYDQAQKEIRDKEIEFNRKLEDENKKQMALKQEISMIEQELANAKSINDEKEIKRLGEKLISLGKEVSSNAELARIMKEGMDATNKARELENQKVKENIKITEEKMKVAQREYDDAIVKSNGLQEQILKVKETAQTSASSMLEVFSSAYDNLLAKSEYVSQSMISQFANMENVIKNMFAKVSDLQSSYAGAFANLPTASNGNWQGAMEYHASGGYISGDGSDTSDSIPAMLSNGEFIMQSKAVRAIGVDFLDKLNNNPTQALAIVKQRQMEKVINNINHMIPPQKFASGGAVGQPINNSNDNIYHNNNNNQSTSTVIQAVHVHGVQDIKGMIKEIERISRVDPVKFNIGSNFRK